MIVFALHLGLVFLDPIQESHQRDNSTTSTRGKCRISNRTTSNTQIVRRTFSQGVRCSDWYITMAFSLRVGMPVSLDVNCDY
jgi:hypothetical protein